MATATTATTAPQQQPSSTMPTTSSTATATSTSTGAGGGATANDAQRKSRRRGENEGNKTATDRDMLIEQLRHQIEEYFSEQNLQNDPQLRNQMTEDGYIDITVLMNAKLINTLSADHALIIESIRRSKRLKMNSQETMVRSVPLSERCTLILRDMPPEVNREEILQIFAHPECGVVKEVRPDIGNTWFVKFHTEEECLKTVRYLQQNGSFRNKPLHVRVKSSNLYKALPIGDIGAIPPAPAIDPADYDATFQMIGQDTNLPDEESIDVGTFEPEMQPFDNRFYGYPMNAAYDSYYLDNEQTMFMPSPMDVSSKYQRQPRPTDLQNIEAMQRKPQREKRPTTNISGNRILADALPPTRVNEPIYQNNLSGTGGVRKSPSLNQQETSDYPGTFLFYDKDKFLEVYQSMNPDAQLDIPTTMAGRDQRVITETVLPPISLLPPEEELEELPNAKDPPETKPAQDEDVPPYVEEFEERRGPAPGKGRGGGWARGRGVARGNQRPGRGRLRNIRSFPGHQKQQYYEYDTFEETRNNRNRNNNYYNNNYSSYNTYEYYSYRTSTSNNNNSSNNNKNKNNNNNQKSNNNNNKRPPKSGTATSTQKNPNQPRWIVAGSQTQKQEETQQNQNKTKNNRRNQNSTQVKYVPKVDASEQKYRPKAQPVS